MVALPSCLGHCRPAVIATVRSTVHIHDDRHASTRDSWQVPPCLVTTRDQPSKRSRTSALTALRPPPGSLAESVGPDPRGPPDALKGALRVRHRRCSYRLACLRCQVPGKAHGPYGARPAYRRKGGRTYEGFF